ncbi:Ubiquitin conjugation factor E4 [Savitreella phatthalungensis]
MDDRREVERRKRLARLGASQAVSTPTPPPQESGNPAGQKHESAVLIHRERARLSPGIAVKRETAVDLSAIDSASSKQANEVSGRSFDLATWADDTIGAVFHVTLDPMRADRFYLESLHTELSEELRDDEQAPRFHNDIVDRLILSRLGEAVPDSAFDYLLESFRRADALERNVRREKGHLEDKLFLLTELKRLAVSYATLSVIMPDIFEHDHPQADLVARLLQQDQEDMGLPSSFLSALVSRLSEDGVEAVAQFFEPILRALSRSLLLLTMTEDHFRFFAAIKMLLRHREVASVFVRMAEFIPEDATASDYELRSLLGPYFRLSPIEGRAVAKAFNGVSESNPLALRDAIGAVRMAIPALHAQLFDLVNLLVRCTTETRIGVLKFFSRALLLNKKRHALHVDASTVATDGFMVNSTAILDLFADPFVADMTKISKIDIDYLRRHDSLVKLEDETRLAASLEETQRYFSSILSGENNFISHIFFLDVAFHHYGMGAALVTHESLLNRTRDMQRYLDGLRAQQPFQGPQAMVMTMQFQRIEQQLIRAKEVSFAYEALLCDDKIQLKSLNFLSLVASWLLRLVDRKHAYPASSIVLPLEDIQSTAAEAYRNLPEYFVEDICESFLYVSRFMPRMLMSTDNTHLVDFALTFIQSPSGYMKNPFLKAKLVETLYNGVRPFDRSDKFGALGGILHSHPFALEHLFPALMTFYIQAESTGASSQFYDKFNIRYHISHIFKSIWHNPQHRDQLTKQFEQDLDFFVRFVALLLNDQTYLLDEALAKLTEIHTLQQELGPESVTDAMATDELENARSSSVDAEQSEEERRRERSRTLEQSERAATSYMQLGTETLQMLDLFTASIADAFCTPEVVDRLAAMLDYNVSQLVGPRCTELKVRSPEKYFFDPKRLLSGIAGILLNMSDQARFVDAVARDGRSYRRELYDRVVSILGRFGMRSSTELERLQRFADRVDIRKREIELEDEDLGDIPEEFLDPLTSDLMRHPVVLPTSRTVCDLSTIKRHLLNDPTDPFNRTPLNIEQVKPDQELQARIEAFVMASRRQ